MERLDQGHLHPLLEQPGPERSRQGIEHCLSLCFHKRSDKITKFYLHSIISHMERQRDRDKETQGDRGARERETGLLIGEYGFLC
jgi:hypothetical protein